MGLIVSVVLDKTQRLLSRDGEIYSVEKEQNAANFAQQTPLSPPRRGDRHPVLAILDFL